MATAMAEAPAREMQRSGLEWSSEVTAGQQQMELAETEQNAVEGADDAVVAMATTDSSCADWERVGSGTRIWGWEHV
jgi:hypothetical protein